MYTLPFLNHVLDGEEGVMCVINVTNKTNDVLVTLLVDLRAVFNESSIFNENQYDI